MNEGRKGIPNRKNSGNKGLAGEETELAELMVAVQSGRSRGSAKSNRRKYGWDDRYRAYHCRWLRKYILEMPD